MTLSQLDGAFQEGVIDEKTDLRQKGTLEWASIARVAGIEADAAPPPQHAPSSRAAVAREVFPSGDDQNFRLSEYDLTFMRKRRWPAPVLVLVLLGVGAITFVKRDVAFQRYPAITAALGSRPPALATSATVMPVAAPPPAATASAAASAAASRPSSPEDATPAAKSKGTPSKAKPARKK